MKAFTFLVTTITYGKDPCYFHKSGIKPYFSLVDNIWEIRLAWHEDSVNCKVHLKAGNGSKKAFKTIDTTECEWKCC